MAADSVEARAAAVALRGAVADLRGAVADFHLHPATPWCGGADARSKRRGRGREGEEEAEEHSGIRDETTRRMSPTKQ